MVADDVDRLHEWMESGAEPTLNEARAFLGKHRTAVNRRLDLIPNHWRYRDYSGYRYSFRYALVRTGDKDEEHNVKHYPKRSEWPGWNGRLSADMPSRRCRAVLQWAEMTTRELAELAQCSLRTARESIEKWRDTHALPV